ncbi:MAG: dienelactone hydrolase family protein [Proteobacteria bacterium]|nr:dienelactone hydrolase family protein [Pseudomonadota bacterium]
MEKIKDYLVFGPANSPLTLILAHGAGAPMTAPFMISIADQIAAGGFRVVLFEFDYMKRADAEGRRFPPDRPPKLLERWRTVLRDFQDGPVVIGGKSMGGRMASMLMAEDPSLAKGLVCLGYPFHPPGRPENLRTGHLDLIRCPTLICQGERDPLGALDLVTSLNLPENFSIYWLDDGDHGFKPRVSSGRTEEQNLAEAANRVVAFMKEL